MFKIRALASRTLPVMAWLLFALSAAHAQTAETGANAADPASIEVVIETSLGNFTLALDPVRAPRTVANFLSYVDSGFYTNTLFHRVIPDFVIQGGGFESGMRLKPTMPPVENEADNGLVNARGTISMARPGDPNGATSQFFINLKHNIALDRRSGQPGYAVFGKVIEGMDVVERIAAVPTLDLGRYKDVPSADVVIHSAYRKGGLAAAGDGKESFQSGIHYTMLPQPVASSTPERIEVVELFSFGCPHCYELDTHIAQWAEQAGEDVVLRQLPAIWNPPMKTLAQAYFAAQSLGVEKSTHMKLFEAIVVDQQQISTPEELAAFYAGNGVDEEAFNTAFASDAVAQQVTQAEALTRRYNPAGVPEIIVAGKYRVDRMRAGGLAQMVLVMDYLVEKELESLE